MMVLGMFFFNFSEEVSSSRDLVSRFIEEQGGTFDQVPGRARLGSRPPVNMVFSPLVVDPCPGNPEFKSILYDAPPLGAGYLSCVLRGAPLARGFLTTFFTILITPYAPARRTLKSFSPTASHFSLSFLDLKTETNGAPNWGADGNTSDMPCTTTLAN